MSGSFAGDGKAKVLQTVNLVELIGKTVSLKRRGRNYIGLCPFHSEKTPSFNVDPVKQYFKCFGCKEGGNAIDFVMKRDRVTFVEALRQLADEYNIELPRMSGNDTQKQNAGERQLLLEANSAACALFEKLLSHPQQGNAARVYLEKRGFSAESIQRFQIGLSADAWDSLANDPAMKKFGPDLLHRAGLAKRRENAPGVYDTFRNRLMFPIRDENARIIAFGGRKMREEDEPKYLNSPETPLFSKSKSVYGIDLARQKVVETRTVAVVEGYTDVVMAHQYGATNVVSILGTALTEQHVGILRRFADRIVLLFDPDSAGETAVARAVELFLTQPVEILIATLPEELDPDEYLMKFGVDAFNAVIASAQDALSYKWRQLTREVKDSDLTSKQKAVREYLDVIAGARGSGPIDSFRWGQALSRVSRLTEMSTDELNRMFKARRPVAQADAKPQAAKPVARLDADHRARRWILGVLLAEPNRWQDVQRHVKAADFAFDNASGNAALEAIAQRYWTHQKDEGEPVLNEFLSLLDEGEKSLAIELIEEVEAMTDLSRTLDDAMQHIEHSRRRLDEKKTLAALRRTVDQATSPDARRDAAEKPASDEDEIELLRRLAAHVANPDLRR